MLLTRDSQYWVACKLVVKSYEPIAEDINSMKLAKTLSISLSTIAILASTAHAQPVSNLSTALQNAAPGDIIETTDSDFGSVDLRNFSFAEPVTIKFHEEARLSKLTLRNIQGLTLEGLSIVAGVSSNPNGQNAVRVFGGSDITFRASSFEWAADGNPLNDGTAIFVDGANAITVEGSQFSDVRAGIHIRGSSNAVIRDSHFRSVLVDGIILSGTDGALIEKNSCADFTTIDGLGLHPDCIQLQAGGQRVANTDVMIRENIVLQGSGSRSQGIFVKSNFAGIPHINVTIEDNVVIQSNGNGIYGENVYGLTIRDNQVRSSFDAEAAPRIIARDPSQNVLIEGNSAAVISAPAHAVVQDNEILD